MLFNKPTIKVYFIKYCILFKLIYFLKYLLQMFLNHVDKYTIAFVD